MAHSNLKQANTQLTSASLPGESVAGPWIQLQGLPREQTKLKRARSAKADLKEEIKSHENNNVDNSI
jgi:hypothetical protein